MHWCWCKYLVVIVQDDQLAEAEVSPQRARLRGNPLLQAPVSANHVREIVHNLHVGNYNTKISRKVEENSVSQNVTGRAALSVQRAYAWRLLYCVFPSRDL